MKNIKLVKLRHANKLLADLVKKYNLTQKSLLPLFKEAKIKVSAPMLSFINNLDKNLKTEEGRLNLNKVSPEDLDELIVILETLSPEIITGLKSKKFSDSEVKVKSDYLSKILRTKEIDPERLIKFEGLYDLYRLSNDGMTIRCYPLKIENGLVTVKEEQQNGNRKDEMVYTGGIHFALPELLFVRITEKNQEVGFYPRIFFRVSKNIDTHQFKFLEGVSMRISHEDRPTVSRDILVKSNASTFDEMLYREIPLKSKEYDELNNLIKGIPLAKQLTGLVGNTFQAHSDAGKLLEKENLGAVYFNAACMCVLEKNLKKAREYFTKAVTEGFDDEDLKQSISKKYPVIKSLLKEII